MRRGDIVTVAAPGDYGKPRPAVIIQADVLNDAAQSTIVALVTGHLLDAPLLRLTLQPDPGNGLQKSSQVQINRLLTLPDRQGRCDDRAALRGRITIHR